MYMGRDMLSDDTLMMKTLKWSTGAQALVLSCTDADALMLMSWCWGSDADALMQIRWCWCADAEMTQWVTSLSEIRENTCEITLRTCRSALTALGHANHLFFGQSQCQSDYNVAQSHLFWKKTSVLYIGLWHLCRRRALFLKSQHRNFVFPVISTNSKSQTC